jgi:hypothetical protein
MIFIIQEYHIFLPSTNIQKEKVHAPRGFTYTDKRTSRLQYNKECGSYPFSFCIRVKLKHVRTDEL